MHPERPPVPGLPVRNLSEVAVADLLLEPGCPVCREAALRAARFIESMLWESVNDVGFRRTLDAARGFCRRHTVQMLLWERSRSGGSLGSAILFGAVLAVREGETVGIHGSSGRARTRRMAYARRAPACPVCGDVAGAQEAVIGNLLRLAPDPEWREALSAAPFCFDHLLDLMARSTSTEPWRAIEARQIERLTAMRGRLEAFAHNSSYDRRHLITDDERHSIDDVAGLLGGSD